jgi:hypothetical protein
MSSAIKVKREPLHDAVARAFLANAIHARAQVLQWGPAPPDGHELVLTVQHELAWPTHTGGNFTYKGVQIVALNPLLRWRGYGFYVPDMCAQVRRHERAINLRLQARRN